MTKDKNIANIVQQLNSLSIANTQHILKFIKDTKKKITNREPEHIDREGISLQEVDTIILLTKGVDNNKYKQATMHKLPRNNGSFVQLILQPLEDLDYI